MNMWHMWKNIAYRVLEEKLEGRRPLERPSFRWEDDVKMYVIEIERKEMNWFHLAEDREIS
jgi:hypothetical protein